MQFAVKVIHYLISECNKKICPPSSFIPYTLRNPDLSIAPQLLPWLGLWSAGSYQLKLSETTTTTHNVGQRQESLEPTRAEQHKGHLISK